MVICDTVTVKQVIFFFFFFFFFRVQSVLIIERYTPVNQVMVATLLAATLYQRNPDRNHGLWNIGSTEIYTPHACAAAMLIHIYKWKVHNGKIEIIFFVIKFRS
jgi:hypothetical protein